MAPCYLHGAVWLAGAALVALAACTERPRAGAHPTGDAPVPASSDAGSNGAGSADGSTAANASSDASADGALASIDGGGPPLTSDPRFASAAPTRGKSIGHTSVVFKLGLEGDVEAAYKPRSRRGAERFRGEIAAYRLSRALGLDNVPPAYPRSFALEALRGALAPAAVELLDREAVAEANGEVRGAIIPWIPKLEFLPLEEAAWRTRWQGWLERGAAIPDADRPLATQISTMIVFDLVTGNWDRWSGANIGIDRATGTLLFVDNDGAFFDPPPAEPLARQRTELTRVRRFSRPFIDALRAMDEAALTAAFGDESPGHPLLPPRIVHAADERRRAALAVIDATTAREGKAAFF